MRKKPFSRSPIIILLSYGIATVALFDYWVVYYIGFETIQIFDGSSTRGTAMLPNWATGILLIFYGVGILVGLFYNFLRNISPNEKVVQRNFLITNILVIIPWLGTIIYIFCGYFVGEEVREILENSFWSWLVANLVAIVWWWRAYTEEPREEEYGDQDILDDWKTTLTTQ